MKNSKTIKIARKLYIFPILLLTLLLTNFASAAGNAVVSVSAPAGAIEPGEQFTVNISVEPNNAIAGIQFDLSFDPSIVSVNSIAEGNLLNQGGADTYFNEGNIDNVAGTITGVFGAIISPGQTVATAGNFAVITMTAGGVGGSCTLTLSNVVVGNAAGQAIPADVNGTTISVNRPPVLNAVGNRVTNEGQTISFTILATDPDADSLVYSASNLPAGASFVPATRTFTWTPSHSQSGTYGEIQFMVSDGNLTDSEEISIIVNNVLQPDVTDDMFVNVLDIISIAQHWGETGANGWIPEDVNENGTVDVLDVILVGQYWMS